MTDLLERVERAYSSDVTPRLMPWAVAPLLWRAHETKRPRVLIMRTPSWTAAGKTSGGCL